MSASSQSTSPRQKLDVETREDREARLGNLLSSISGPNASPNPHGSPIGSFPSRPFAMPESSVLAKARAFLPMMASSNEALLQRMRENPEDVDIENTKGQDRVIAMDVNLGVFDVNGEARGDLGPEIDMPESRMDQDSDEDDDEDDDEEEKGDQDDDDEEEDSDSERESTSSGSPAELISLQQDDNA